MKRLCGIRPSMRRVLLFESSLSQQTCAAYDAIARYARAMRWELHPIEYDNIFEGQAVHSLVGLPNIGELLDLWHPDGVIVECSGRRSRLSLKAFGKIPVVLLDCPPAHCPKGLSGVSPDEQAIVKVAARELLSLGYEDYAYLPYPTATDWSAGRGREFRRLIGLAGRRFHEIKAELGKLDMSGVILSLARQLEKLPRPLGVFATNDQMARMLASACEHAKLSVPQDVAIIGVDNDQRFCENTSVTLSSVFADFFEMGTCAARLLSVRMENRRRKVASAVCSNVRIVRRMSTRQQGVIDQRLAKALELIRLNACTGLTPAAVAAAMGCSRRFADMRFSAVLGHTVQEEIRAVRLEKVKTLLSRPLTELSEIPSACGYGSMSDLCRDFKKRTGMTLREWRAVR